jgi:hypothetical protein
MIGAAAIVMAASFGACSTQSVEEFKIKNKIREETWDRRFERFSEEGDRRAERNWNWIMN